MEKKIVGFEVAHNSNGINIFITFLPHEYQHIHIPKDHSAAFWLSENDIWEMVKGKETEEL